MKPNGRKGWPYLLNTRVSWFLQVMDVREREVVMHEGDPADKFCILLEGMVSIQKSPEPGKPRKEVAVVKAGEYLGEIGFLNNQPRTASCVAKTKVKVSSSKTLAL